MWRTRVQRGHSAAECAKRGKGDDGKAIGKKRRVNKGKGEGGKGKGGTQQAQQVFEACCNHGWKCGHMEKDCFTLAKREGKGGNNQGSRSLPEAKARNPEDASVGGFGRVLVRKPM